MDRLLNRRQLLRLAGVAAAGTVAAACSNSPHASTAHDGTVHWTYSGEEGPNHWGSLSTKYDGCSTGSDQSPINVTETQISGSTTPMGLSYTPVRGTAVRNGHTLQVNVEPGCTASIDGTEFLLVQFHYHAPSEHTFDGQARAVEWHFVHQSAAKNIAVLAVFAVDGPENPAFASVLAAAPGQVDTSSPVDGAIDVAAMLPADLNALRYGGSLTTPPCSEPVRWTLLPAPVSMSQRQIATVQGVVDHNDRPVQPLNGRTLQHALVTT